MIEGFATELRMEEIDAMSIDETRDLLAQNNARTRGTGPDWQGFGDDDERPKVEVLSAQNAANDAAFNALPSASQERAGGNGKTTPATKHDDRPFKDQGTAVLWACRFEYYQKRDKNGVSQPDHAHAVGAIQKICKDLGCSERDVDTWADAFMDHVATKAAATDDPKLTPSITHAKLDAQAAADAPQF